MKGFAQVTDPICLGKVLVQRYEMECPCGSVGLQTSGQGSSQSNSKTCLLIWCPFFLNQVCLQKPVYVRERNSQLPGARRQGHLFEKVCVTAMFTSATRLFNVPKISSQTESCSVQWTRFLAVPVPRMIEQFVGSAEDRFSRQNPAADSPTDLWPQFRRKWRNSWVFAHFSQDGVQQRFAEQIFKFPQFHH